ncbi:MAG: hypothetical protein KGQ93_07760 [Cyanobacteria bacterium REEB459]|nr:hypothetical protein [Cyanobacteria bacterium REEB459]
MAKKVHPELQGEKFHTLYTLQFKRTGQVLRDRFSWTALGVCLGVGTAIAVLSLPLVPRGLPWSVGQGQPDAETHFKAGSDQAMQAAELTQSAASREEWVRVALLWQQAIANMAAVPISSPNYVVAQQKRRQYDRNRRYAETNVSNRAADVPGNKAYWTVGSDRDWVIAIQGPPTRIVSYDGSCQERLGYGSSLIELENGYVKQYSNTDANLKVLANTPLALSTQPQPQTWSLGSSTSEVLKLQGTPTRTQQNGVDDLVTLYYGSSSILLDKGHVISYWNNDGSLKVSVNLARPLAHDLPSQRWSVGSSRAQVFKTQPTPPTAISRNDGSCEEVLQFGASQVTLRQGLVAGYKNEGKNLLTR